MRIALVTSDGQAVHDTTIAPFQTRPDVLIWGDWVFQYDWLRPDGTIVYKECFAVAVTDIQPRPRSPVEERRGG